MKEEFDRFKKLWNSKQSHIYSPGKIIKYVFLISQFLFPGIYIRAYFRNERPLNGNLAIDYYIAFKTILILMIFFNRLYIYDIWIFPSNIFVIVVIYFATETFIYTFTLITCNELFSVPKSYLRPLILGFINYIEFVFTFAILYAFTNSLIFTNTCTKNLSSIDYLYFSSITATTIGYGDIIPTLSIGKMLVIFQTIILLFYVTIVFGYNLSRMTNISNK